MAEPRDGRSGTLAGKVAVVTGAAGGLGAAFVAALRGAGASAIGCDVRSGADVLVDVADPAQVRAFVDGVLAEHGRIDVAVANAGVCRMTHPLDPWESALDDFAVQVATNLGGVYHLGRAVAPAMAEAGSGDIVVIGTDHLQPPPGRETGGGSRLDVYDASKWALRGLVEAWARALRGKGVRVTMLNMGATDTGMLRGFLGDDVPDDVVETWMRSEQIADLLVDLLASDTPSGTQLGLWTGHPLPGF